MKLSIKVSMVYPDSPPTEEGSYPTRNVADVYEQQIEIDESVVGERLKNIIKAFNRFD